MATMNAVVFHAGQVFLEAVPRPTGDDADRVAVRVTAGGICGSDLSFLDGKFSAFWDPEGAIPGHEFGGYGPDGKLYAVRPTGACWSCRECGGGRGNACADAFGDAIGLSFNPGGLAEVCVVGKDRLAAVPEGTDPSHVALVEPLAVALHGVNLAKGLDKDTPCCVYGAGTIGLMVVAVLAQRGIAAAVVARHPHQAAAAAKLGGKPVAEAEAGSAEFVFDCVGHSQEALDACVAAARPGGTIVELGGLAVPVQVGPAFFLKELRFVSSVAYTPDAFKEAAGMIGGMGPKLAEAVVTHRFPLREAAKAFEAARDRKSGAIKVQIYNE
ncbi:alcohol dehydrogenase GroES domain-containing protein [Hyaloraphidium curvatum]|nr:alcohol dehydrogenase GroES domain-containing protein [Hyaloraphidium curvatum]